jgi:hypothetical protein
MFFIFSSVRFLGLPHTLGLLKLCVTWIFLETITTVQAQPSQPLGNWQLSGGWQNYSESQMQLKGPELGLHWRSNGMGPISTEADAHLGLQNYNSSQSGRLDSVPNFDFQLRVMTSPQAQSPWQYGLSLHGHSNFLRGTTSLGFGGYDRLTTQIWLPLRWHLDSVNPWTFDTGLLLWGKHLSRLSQVNDRFQNVTNTQKKGFYLQVSNKVYSSWGELEPYARWTWVDDSDVREVTEGEQKRSAYEPQNTRLQMGLKWQFR